MLNTKNLTADFNRDLHVNDYTENLVNSIRVVADKEAFTQAERDFCLLYTSPSPRDRQKSRMPSSA